MSQASDPSIVNKFKAGFTECAKEVDRFQGLEPVVKRRLLQHLSNYLNGVNKSAEQLTAQQVPIAAAAAATTTTTTTVHQASQLQQVQIHMLPSSPPGSPEQSQQSTGAAMIGGSQQQLQQQILKLTPTSGYYLTLPNGIITYVSPAQLSSATQQQTPPPPLPTLVPIPSRTASTASAASSAASSTSAYERLSVRDTSSSPISYAAPPSPANSYEAMDYQESNSAAESPASDSTAAYRQSPPPLSSMATHHRRSADSPLSLVMKKRSHADLMLDDEDRPWRPW